MLGADHHGTRNWYAAVARMLGYDPERVEVLLYQLVHLTRGGEAAKMSKRRGDVVFLDEFLDEVGVDAARWYLVSRGPDQTIEIDVDLAAEKSQSNPVYYVQYAHARIAGILRNAEGAAPSAEPPAELAAEERDLIKRLAEFPAVVAEATERRGPHAIPTYAIRVADDFHRFYHHHKVLGSEAESFRLGLVTATKSVIARALDLIGVEAPDTHVRAVLKVEVILGIVASSIAILAFLARAIANVRQGRRAREARGRNRAARREISPPE